VSTWFKRKIGLKFVVFLSLFVIFSPHLKIKAAENFAEVTASALNVRSGPSTGYRVITSLPRGTVVKIVGTSGSWSKISKDNTSGYVWSNYLKSCGSNKDLTSRGGSTMGQKVADLAKKFLGAQYVWGGTSPSGFDCSGLVYYVYNQLGVKLNRVACDQMKNGHHVSKSNLKPGDIIGFYDYKGSGIVNHVGIYIGGGRMVHAKQPGSGVRTDDITSGSYAKRFADARRIFD
jgi:cell wall-associated NlpC family hydrolase